MATTSPRDIIIEPVDGGVTAPNGFSAAAVASGVKSSGALDVAIVDAGRPVSAAGVFTQNTMAAAPVHLSRKHLADGTARAVVINSGNANACTGDQGERDALLMARTLAHELACKDSDVVVCSTGVIGVPMPAEVVEAGIRRAAGLRGPSASEDVAHAIMTTDTFPKQAAVKVTSGASTWFVGGVAKGSGMIAPNMATMLAVITTDAALSPSACANALSEATALTFNRITVDGDTSTNDTCLLFASGAAGGSEIEAGSPEYDAVASAILKVCSRLARLIVEDGEGATKTVDVTVRNAASDSDARAAARTIAESPLVKTALFGGDANWGRVVMALGNSGATIEPARVSVTFAGIETCRNGMGLEFDEAAAAEALSANEIEIVVDVGMGTSSATVVTCDLSYEYVRINGEYRT